MADDRQRHDDDDTDPATRPSESPSGAGNILAGVQPKSGEDEKGEERRDG